MQVSLTDHVILMLLPEILLTVYPNLILQWYKLSRKWSTSPKPLTSTCPHNVPNNLMALLVWLSLASCFFNMSAADPPTEFSKISWLILVIQKIWHAVKSKFNPLELIQNFNLHHDFKQPWYFQIMTRKNTTLLCQNNTMFLPHYNNSPCSGCNCSQYLLKA